MEDASLKNEETITGGWKNTKISIKSYRKRNPSCILIKE